MGTGIQTQTEITFGQSADIVALSKRIKIMVPGGSKLSDNEAMALAQVSQVTRLNPFIGEVWYIPGRGPMIGIKGARRMDQEAVTLKGGYSFPLFTPCSGDEAGANETQMKDIHAAFKCEITDSLAIASYQKLFLETINSLRSAECKDPVGEAKQIVGPRPVWTGYGFSTRAEESRMNKVQLAQKRAEANALGRRIIIPFGVEVSSSENAVEYINAKVTNMEIIEEGKNPDPVKNETWNKWIAVAERADKAQIPHSQIKRDKVTELDLGAYIEEILPFVLDAERQTS